MWKRKQRFKVKVNSSHYGKYVKSIERINSEIFKTNFKGIGNYRQYPVGEGAPYTLLPLCFLAPIHSTHHTTILLLLYCMWSQVPIRVFPLYYYGSSVLLSLMEFQAIKLYWAEVVYGSKLFPGRSCFGPRCFWAEVGTGTKYFLGQSKYSLGQSMLRAKVSVEQKLSQGQTGCEPPKRCHWI